MYISPRRSTFNECRHTLSAKLRSPPGDMQNARLNGCSGRGPTIYSMSEAALSCLVLPCPVLPCPVLPCPALGALLLLYKGMYAFY